MERTRIFYILLTSMLIIGLSLGLLFGFGFSINDKDDGQFTHFKLKGGNSIGIDIITLMRDDYRVKNASNYKKKNSIVNIFEAVDKQDTNKLQFLRNKYNMVIGGGEAGCALSHLLVMEKFLETNNKYQIILEDDFAIKRNLPTNYLQVEVMFNRINLKPNQVDMLYLTKRIKSDATKRIVNGCGTEGYILTRHGAEKILKLLKNKCDVGIDIKMQAHFYGAKENNWVQRGFIDKNIIINAYKSKWVYVDEYEPEGSARKTYY